MPIVLITNPKGGCGKSTVATNLAGYFARGGHATMLGDLDRQQSALAWLSIRPPELPRIQSWDRSDDKVARPPKGVTHVVLDTPAGLHGHSLRDALRLADRVVIPIQPSIFDIYATETFLGKLADRDLLEGKRIGVLGMRVDARTRAADQLQRFVEGLRLPVLGFVRDTQNYVQLAAH
ncbi:MAG TPA: ParA family protein, partial [Burkholderiaceae bacterium]|nr:ParA family protein [Burkholderiaceae bacterium]